MAAPRPCCSWDSCPYQQSCPFNSNFPTASNPEIREVWRHNLEYEFIILRRVVQKYKIIAMDTEFPGIVLRPLNGFGSRELPYLTIKINVDNLKIIQLGLAFFDEQGNTPLREFGCSSWQFNFQYDLAHDWSARNSIELLKNSGIQFNRHLYEGILPIDFAEIIMSSGIVLRNDVRFVAFHGCYDVAYFLKVLLNAPLPIEEVAFLATAKFFFPNIYDVDFLAKKTNTLYGGLQAVANQFGLGRVGPSHQAGSDALLTGGVFFRVLYYFYNNCLYRELSGCLTGLTRCYSDVKENNKQP